MAERWRYMVAAGVLSIGALTNCGGTPVTSTELCIPHATEASLERYQETITDLAKKAQNYIDFTADQGFWQRFLDHLRDQNSLCDYTSLTQKDNTTRLAYWELGNNNELGPNLLLEETQLPDKLLELKIGFRVDPNGNMTTTNHVWTYQNDKGNLSVLDKHFAMGFQAAPLNPDTLTRTRNFEGATVQQIIPRNHSETPAQIVVTTKAT